MNTCYIIYSPKLDQYYTGISQEDLMSRIQKHNDHSYGDHRFTARTDDWELFYVIECSSFEMAVAIERHIKKMKSVVYIRNLKKFPEITLRLKLKYSDVGLSR